METRVVLETHRYLPSDMLACLPGITFEQLKEFAATLFEVSYFLIPFELFLVNA
jgi:hypothetical protein